MGNYIPVRTSRKRTGSEANLAGEADQDDIAKSRKRYCYQLPVGVPGVPFHDGYLIPKISSSIDDDCSDSGLEAPNSNLLQWTNHG